MLLLLRIDFACGRTVSAAAKSFKLQAQISLKLFQLRPQLARIRPEHPGEKRSEKTHGTQPGAPEKLRVQTRVCYESNRSFSSHGLGKSPKYSLSQRNSQLGCVLSLVNRVDEHVNCQQNSRYQPQLFARSLSPEDKKFAWWENSLLNFPVFQHHEKLTQNSPCHKVL